jgi:CRP-like cAMP-binding protein
MAQRDYLEELVELPLLQSMPDQNKARIAALLSEVSERVTVPDGEALLYQGWLGGEAGYILVRGRVRVSKTNGDEISVPAPALLGEMHQFNPVSQRTATVSAKGEATLLKFAWQQLYAQARQQLSEAEQGMLMDGIERIVWERFDRETLIDLALFRSIPERLRLRVCLPLQWIVQHLTYSHGETLFEREDLCGGTGYVLLQGNIQLAKPNYPAQAVNAPDLVGVMPDFDPGLRWTVTATAQGDVEVLRFSWQEYAALLDRRLSESELSLFRNAINEGAREHLAH